MSAPALPTTPARRPVVVTVAIVRMILPALPAARHAYR
jgi:hypothetical protein